MKKIVLAIIVCTLFFTGCWDRKELNEIGIVIGLGLDKDVRTGKIILTSQVARPEALKKEGGSGQAPPIEIITTTGDTVTEAIKNISRQLDRRPFLSSVKVIIVSDPLARDGLMPIFDFVFRNIEIKNLAWFLIAKNTTAQELLMAKHGIADLQATYLTETIKEGENFSEVSATRAIDVLKGTAGEFNPIAGAVEIISPPSMPTKEKTVQGIKLSGTAIFKKDKLVGYLDNTETRGLNWITGKIRGAVINVPSPHEADRMIAITVNKASRHITPINDDGKISFIIKIKLEGNIEEQQDTANYFENIEDIKQLEIAANNVIEQEIKMTINKVQQEFDSDVLGFGNVFSKKNPQEWNNIKDEWENIFPTVPYTVEVDAKLIRLGLAVKPIKTNDSK